MQNTSVRRRVKKLTWRAASIKVLLFGYGNPGRLDDGLGPAWAERMEVAQLPEVTVDSDYQLNLEDAAVLAEHDLAIFGDASTEAVEPFSFDEIKPEPGLGFTSHKLSPTQLLAVCRDLFGKEPKAFLLGIRGYKFNEFGQGLSEEAQSNLDAAVEFVMEYLRSLSEGKP